MHRRELLSAAAAGLASPATAQMAEPVDMLLVLAVDVSRSIDEDEARLQREGYRAGVCDGRVVEAITRGMLGAIGVAYVEWAGFEYQRLVLPWQRIGSAGSITVSVQQSHIEICVIVLQDCVHKFDCGHNAQYLREPKIFDPANPSQIFA